jgi:hypothetical protein
MELPDDSDDMEYNQEYLVKERLNTLRPRIKEYIESSAYNDEEVYYRYGIIDFLQDYTRKKRLETIYLRKRFSKKPQNCFSCVDP